MNEIGEQEYQYSLCAKECGIEMEETRLFPSKRCNGYFGTKRFDRVKKENGDTDRVHMISMSALLETSHRIPNLDYHILMKVVLELTKDYDENCGKWRLSPAYDLTYSSSIGGEHATTVNGNGVNPNMEDIMEVAKAIGMNTKRAKIIAQEIQECVKSFFE